MKVTLQTCAPKIFRLCRLGAERRVSRAQTRERGPPSALADIETINYNREGMGTTMYARLRQAPHKVMLRINLTVIITMRMTRQLIRLMPNLDTLNGNVDSSIEFN